MGENIPLKSNDLEKMFNDRIAQYGWKNEIKEEREKGEAENENKDDETYRTSLRRQRDKILYTGGFRRLQDKTQVISAMVEGDHRTRLTHTLEVEQIAISIANALRLNVDLVSAIALGHDVGHTPFGHAAERKLNELLEEDGGFHHPIQSIRYLWEKYGSKIESVIYEGILLHDSDMFKIERKDVEKQFYYLEKVKGEAEDFQEWVELDKWLNHTFPSTLEAQVVIWADKIAYITHDLEDFLRCSIYTNLKENNNAIEDELLDHLNGLLNSKIEVMDDYHSRDLIRNIIGNLIISSANNITKISGLSQSIVREKTRERYNNKGTSNKKYLDGLIINFNEEYRECYYKLRKFLDEYYILSPEVQRSDAKAEVIVEWLFTKFSKKHELLPLKIRNEIDYTILEESYNDDCLGEIVNELYDGVEKDQRRISQLKKKLEDLNPNKDKRIKTKEDLAYDDIKSKVVKRKVAGYIATMSDTYAENMYRDLIGSSVDFNL